MRQLPYELKCGSFSVENVIEMKIIYKNECLKLCKTPKMKI